LHSNNSARSTSLSTRVGSTTKLDKWNLWQPPVKLRGANIWQTRIDPVRDGDSLGAGPLGPPYGATDFLKLAKLGANLVVISHPGVYSESAPYQVDAAAFANLDRLLASIRAADMFAVIAFRTGPGRNEDAVAQPSRQTADHTVWASEAAQGAWATMWRETARRYRSSGVVVGYNLMVEPNANDALLCISKPSDFYPRFANTIYDWNALASHLIAAIRAEDSATPILVGGMNASDIVWLSSLKNFGDARLVYSVHQYQPEALTQQADPAGAIARYGPSQAYNKSDLATVFKQVTDFKARRSALVAVDEFGISRWAPGAATFLGDQMDLMENAGTNYAVWLWESSHSGIDYDEFDFRKGNDRLIHVDVLPNPLTATLASHFALNKERPSRYGSQ
jgi:hypothetical protein